MAPTLQSVIGTELSPVLARYRLSVPNELVYVRYLDPLRQNLENYYKENVFNF